MEWLDDEHLVDADALTEARHERRQRADAVLADVDDDRDRRFDRDQVPQRWDEITALLDAGNSVTMTHDGAPWCTLTPTRSGAQPDRGDEE